jgi:hypothetical protein
MKLQVGRGAFIPRDSSGSLADVAIERQTNGRRRSWSMGIRGVRHLRAEGEVNRVIAGRMPDVV